MIFIRENRAARWFSILNIVGLVILVLSAAVYLTGVYPTSLRYRIVGGAQDDVAQTELIGKRLADYPGARLRSSGSNRIEVVTWARDLNAVKNCLRITKSPSLVAILAKPSKDPTSAEDFNCHSIAEGLETTKFLTKKSAAEILSVACLPTEMKLASDLVKEISRSPSSNSLSDAIKLELTSAGRKSVTELLSLTADADEKIAAIGLMIDGVVQGIAELDDQSTQRLNLVLSKTLRVEESGLSAAIRGPELPFDLELLP